jgi:phage terminase large subunit-like protein
MSGYPNVNAANKYARDIVAGKIPANEFIKLACKRHLTDLQKQKNKDFPFRFDRAAAERVCRFMQKLPHTKGEWLRRKLKITLEPWQLFFFASGFGWLKKSDNTRRFRELLLKVPRKNGKSIIAAGVGLFGLCADHEYGAEVYCGATNEKQAWEVFKPARLMVQKLPNLRKKFGLEIHAKKLTKDDGSVFEPVIGQPGDGSSPHIAIIDEYHEHGSSDQYDTFDTGMGSREQPFILVITTAGDDIESPCYDFEQRVIEMLRGTKDDAVFGLVYGIDENDDWTDPQVLIKANPNYGISVKADYLLAQQQKAITRPRFTNRFKTKHLNVWVSAKEAYFNMEKWKACEDTSLTIDNFIGENCIQACDLARKLDMNSKARIFWKMIDGRRHWYCIAPQFWVPYDTAFDNEIKSLGERFQKYINLGVLSVTDGAEIDYREIQDDIEKSHLETPSIRVPLDPHGATNLGHHLMDEGLDVVTITQNYTNLSDPMKELEAAIASNRFHHDGNPIMTWCIANVIGKFLPGNDDVVRPIKQKSVNKIDGAVALIMAIGEAMLQDREPQQEESIYDTGDVGC